MKKWLKLVSSVTIYMIGVTTLFFGLSGIWVKRYIPGAVAFITGVVLVIPFEKKLGFLKSALLKLGVFIIGIIIFLKVL